MEEPEAWLEAVTHQRLLALTQVDQMMMEQMRLDELVSLKWSQLEEAMVVQLESSQVSSSTKFHCRNLEQKEKK